MASGTRGGVATLLNRTPVTEIVETKASARDEPLATYDFTSTWEKLG